MYKRTLAFELDRWKSSASRKPLILRGARQVGKTTLVEMFATGFDYFVHLNLDKSEDRLIFERNDNIATIIQIL